MSIRAQTHRAIAAASIRARTHRVIAAASIRAHTHRVLPAALDPSAGEKRPQAPLLKTLAFARPAAGRLALATLLGAGSAGAAIGLIATSAWLISRSSEHPQESAVAVAIVGVQFFALSRGLCRYAERLVGHDAAFRVLSNLRVSIYKRLERLAPLGLPAFRGGELLARLVHDVDSLQDLLLRVVPPFAIALIAGVATVALVSWMLPAAGLILAVALLTGGVLVPWLTGRLAAHGEAKQAEVRGRLTASVVDLIEGAPELVANGVAVEQLKRTRADDADLTRIAKASARTAGIGQGLTSLCCGLAMWGSLIAGVEALRAGRMDGVLLAGLALIPLVAFELLSGLPAATQTLQRVRRAAARVQEVLDTPPPVREPRHPRMLATLDDRPCGGQSRKGHASNGQSQNGHVSYARPGLRETNVQRSHTLRARGLGCSYPRETHPALRGIDLDLSPGRRLAVVGPSGAGKSTLAGVLLRLIDYQGGMVTLDGVEIAELAGDDVRRVVGMVSQDAHVFDSTLEENLRLARRGATLGECHHALAQARLLDWVEGLPAGLQTEVGERGARMSGGQRQRLALARALLADFPILIAEEPGEHLDTDTADAIVSDLLAAREDRATLLITHRLAGLEEVEEVLVLDHGAVLERGTHTELLARHGHYAGSWLRELPSHPEPDTGSWAHEPSSNTGSWSHDPGKGDRA
ncbi:MAG TPA: thiol reductant ABC exporter subunit CydC [Solirubrobacteraceae bacterium]|jgi:thiol reductant ABC exporter CydC subunit|nr:thiol reductant ABC exporter subunit CydC [Solirubrobacteraceae bacterium]